MIIQTLGLMAAIGIANLAFNTWGDLVGVLYYYVIIFGFYEVDQIVWDALSKENL